MIFYSYKLKGIITDTVADQWSTSYQDVYAFAASGRPDIVPKEIISQDFEETIAHSLLSHFAHWTCVDIRQQRYFLCLNSEYAVFGGRSALAEVIKITNEQTSFRVVGMELVGLSKSTVVFNHSPGSYSKTLKDAMEQVEQQILGRLKKFSAVSLKLYEGVGYA